MYTPACFAETEQKTLHEFIIGNSFATIISTDGNQPVATHMPLLLEREFGAHGRLVGHFARANAQRRTIDSQQVLTVFSGPHAYISPAWYTARNVVPTWNYVSVHAYGRFELVPDRDQLRKIVTRYVDVYEAGYDQPWSLDSVDPDFVDGLLDAIVGFTVHIERIEGKWKLSQNHSDLPRQRVVDRLRNQGDENSVAIADLMSQVNGLNSTED